MRPGPGEKIFIDLPVAGRVNGDVGMNEDLKRILEKQKYRVVGEHSGVKVCHWLGQRLIHGRSCYKQRFYGINSHRCLQMTPAVNMPPRMVTTPRVTVSNARGTWVCIRMP